MKQIYDFMVNYLGYELDYMSDKEIINLIEFLYNTGEHPKVELFVDTNYDLFEELDWSSSFFYFRIY